MPARATIFPEHQSRSAIARILAPLALVACAAALIVVISGGLAGDDGENGGGQRGEQPRSDQPRQEPKPQSDTYTVATGDTLSEIAAKTGVRLGRLERLNPDLDPATLNAGQQIKLR